MKKQLLKLAIFGTFIAVNFLGTAEASNLDTYRNLLTKNTLTIKYENITPMPRVTNRDKTNFYGKDGMNIGKVNIFANRQLSGIVVINGNDKYEEVGYGDSSVCSLTKDGQVYQFSKQVTPKKTTYYGLSGGGKNKVAPIKRDFMALAINGNSYADAGLTRLLGAILPNSQKSMDMPVYEFVGSGWLDNGLNYEDYKSNQDGVFEAVRYYFNGYNLVKIAAASYYTLPDGKIDGHKTIIKINEFSPTPDVTYLSLPKAIKVSK